MVMIAFPDQLAQSLQSAAEQKQQSIPDFVENLLQEHAQLLKQQMEVQPIQSVWSADELEALKQLIANPTPLSGEEIIAQGLTGTWADMGISDSTEWVNEQRRKRRAKGQW